MNDINYMQVIPNSQFYTNIEQILNYLNYLKYPIPGTSNEEALKYLVIGLQNTIKNGYNIQKIDGKE